MSNRAECEYCGRGFHPPERLQAHLKSCGPDSHFAKEARAKKAKSGIEPPTAKSQAQLMAPTAFKEVVPKKNLEPLQPPRLPSIAPPTSKDVTPPPKAAVQSGVKAVPNVDAKAGKPASFCGECGNKFDVAAKFCANCGVKRVSI
jgi:hypothetical protein